MSSSRASSSKMEPSNSHSPSGDHEPAYGIGVKAETPDYETAVNTNGVATKDGDGDSGLGDSYASRSTSVETKLESLAVKLDDSRPSATPPVSSRSKAKSEPQLIGHLPRAEEAAFRTFVEIPENHYQYGTLGRSREALESMTCDCQYDPGVDDPLDACGSDCINRLTQVECLPDDCRCRSYCQNQRFQRKDYAQIEIVKTEKKGFGLRAAVDMPKDTFIYEYLGDVVSQPSFLKRMRQYAEEGIRHFYFMMLQKDEFIDATKRGGIGRFANHSCNPNCYVAKWTVDQHVRMGIFTSRNIKKDEELTFNYNVDRYGHDAQPCYCGEANCVGFIGGKTQTDIAAMDDLYLDALGISEEVATLGLKGSKKRKSKKLDEDFVPTLKPLLEKDVPKVVQAMRQTQSRKVLVKLLTRVKLTEDLSALRQIMRLRGFSVMTNVLEDYPNDLEVSTLALECMMTWPLIQRNKVEDSKVNVPVQACAQSDNEVLAQLAQKLLAQWETLEYAYRIPKRLKGEGEEDESYPATDSPLNVVRDPRPFKRPKEDIYDAPQFVLKPLQRPTPKPGTPDIPKPVTGWGGPPIILDPAQAKRQEWERLTAKRSQHVATIIAKAQAEAEAAAAAASLAAANAQATMSQAGEGSSRKKSSKHRKQSKEEKEANKEKRLLKLVGAVVVKCMSKYAKQMSHDQFKKYAKELTHIIAEKEKKSSSYKEGRLDSLSEEKMTKIKKFAKEYMVKVIRKLEKSGQRQHFASAPQEESSMSASASGSTVGQDDAHEEMDISSVMPELAGADAMDMDDDDEDMGEGDSYDHDQSPPDSISPQTVGTARSPGVSSQSLAGSVADPRLRHRNEECGWDPDQDKLSVRQGLSTVSVGS